MDKNNGKVMISFICFIFGCFCLFYPSLITYKSKLEQQAFIVSLEANSSNDTATPVVFSFNESNNPNELSSTTYSIGSPLGILSIPFLEVECVIVEGTSSNELDIGIGHIVGSGLFNGNTVLAAHRATYFKHLDNLDIGSSIILNDLLENSYEYIVYESFIVSPDEVWVVEDIGEDIVTLVTCTNGNKERLIVRAKLEQ